MKEYLYSFTKSGRWRAVSTRSTGSTARRAGTSGPVFFFSQRLARRRPLSRRSGSTAGRAGTSGLAEVPVALPVQLPENNRSDAALVPEVAPEETTGSSAEDAGTSGLPEVPVLLPVLLPGHSRSEIS